MYDRDDLDIEPADFFDAPATAPAPAPQPAGDEPPALKSCPCCGWIAPLIAYDHFCFADGPGWQLRCDKCSLQTCWWHSEAEAIAAWNARVRCRL